MSKAAIQKAKDWEGLDGQDYASKVSCAAPYAWDTDGSITATWGIAAELPPADLHIVAYDFGIKWNILRRMRLAGMKVTVVPAQTPADKVLAMKPDGVFLSNGPADPAGVTYAIDTTKKASWKGAPHGYLPGPSDPWPGCRRQHLPAEIRPSWLQSAGEGFKNRQG